MGDKKDHLVRHAGLSPGPSYPPRDKGMDELKKVYDADTILLRDKEIARLTAEVELLKERRDSDRAVVCTACYKRIERMDRARYLIHLRVMADKSEGG